MANGVGSVDTSAAETRNRRVRPLAGQPLRRASKAARLSFRGCDSTYTHVGTPLTPGTCDYMWRVVTSANSLLTKSLLVSLVLITFLLFRLVIPTAVPNPCVLFVSVTGPRRPQVLTRQQPVLLPLVTLVTPL